MTRKRCPICSKRFSRRFCTSRHEDVCTLCCGIMMEEDPLTKEERLMYRRRHFGLERKNRTVVAEGGTRTTTHVSSSTLTTYAATDL